MIVRSHLYPKPHWLSARQKAEIYRALSFIPAGVAALPGRCERSTHFRSNPVR